MSHNDKDMRQLVVVYLTLCETNSVARAANHSDAVIGGPIGKARTLVILPRLLTDSQKQDCGAILREP